MLKAQGLFIWPVFNLCQATIFDCSVILLYSISMNFCLFYWKSRGISCALGVSGHTAFCFGWLLVTESSQTWCWGLRTAQCTLQLCRNFSKQLDLKQEVFDSAGWFETACATCIYCSEETVAISALVHTLYSSIQKSLVWNVILSVFEHHGDYSLRSVSSILLIINLY